MNIYTLCEPCTLAVSETFLLPVLFEKCLPTRASIFAFGVLENPEGYRIRSQGRRLLEFLSYSFQRSCSFIFQFIRAAGKSTERESTVAYTANAAPPPLSGSTTTYIHPCTPQRASLSKNIQDTEDVESLHPDLLLSYSTLYSLFLYPFLLICIFLSNISRSQLEIQNLENMDYPGVRITFSAMRPA